MAMTSIENRTVWARDTIDQALREDVEAGAISYNDFEQTKRFASAAVQYQYYATFAGVGAVVGTVFYRHWYRRQPFSLRSAIFLPLVYTMGSAPCWLAQANAFKRYQRSLENPETTMKALLKSRGIVVLTAGEDPKYRRDLAQQVNINNSDKNSPDSATGTRWEELRKANDIVKPSSWDRIRQSHEQKSRSQTQSEQAKPVPQFTDKQVSPSSEREIEQAKFDALLEAERKMSE